MLNHVRAALPLEAIRDYCTGQPIKRLALFGSVLRPDFDSESDVDLLIEFLPGAKIGYFKLVEMQDQLADLIGRRVDLLTPGAISPYFRDDVLAEAQVIYEAKPRK